MTGYVHAFQSSIGVMLFLIVWVLIFSIIGVKYFAGVKHGARGITMDANYDSYLCDYL